jgi:hypothetical protein
VNEVETIADNDEGKLVGKFGLLEEVLDLFGVIVIAFPANTLDLTDLSRAGGCLDILEVNLWILTKIDDRAKVVIQALEALIALEHLNKLDRAKDIGVFGTDLDDDLKVLADVDA